jgi:sigma-B regulation protein RsbU (phosphoserine phosphatase)
VQSIYNLVGDKIRDIFDSQVVMISTVDLETNTMEHRYAIERGERIIAPGHHEVRGFRSQIIQTRKPVLVSSNVPEIAASLGQYTLPGTITPKTWLGVPMMVGGEVTGILSLQDVEKEYAFDESVVRLLETLAASMSVALENARLWEQEKLFLKALERELEIGREIQAGFLPECLPQPPGWEIASTLESAREVTGDFYDVFELKQGRIGLVIADVCDKGLGAALFMTLFRSLIRAVSRIDFFTNAEYSSRMTSALRVQNAISLTNNYFAETRGSTSMFCTIFFGVLDTRTGRLTYSNGGHLPPVILTHGRVREILKVNGPAVGLSSGAAYSTSTVTIEPGDVFFAHTDGLTDTENPHGDTLDLELLLPLLAGDNPLAEHLRRIQEYVCEFSGGAQNDDITMLEVRRK